MIKTLYENEQKREFSEHFDGGKAIDDRDKYDWNPKMKGTHFVRGRKVAGDIGMVRLDRSGTKKDLLCILYSRGYLTGQAFKDAEDYCYREKTQVETPTSVSDSGSSAGEAQSI